MNKYKLSIISILSVMMIITMIGCDSTIQYPNEDASEIQKINPVQSAHSGSVVYVDANTSGTEDGSQSNPYNEIQEGIDHAGSGETVTFLSDFTLSSQVTISSSLTLDGNGHTIHTSFTETGNGNNAGIGVIGASDVTVSNLTINGSGGTDLHGINVYESTGVLVSDVFLKDNARTGLVVNGSEVIAHNISTAGHSWHGMNVGQGGGVTDPAILTVTGTSSHAEGSVPDIFVDDISQDVTVNDPNEQYISDVIDFRGGEAEVYTHYKSLSKDDCKDGGYADYGFKNQGQCIQFVNTGKR
ncbi:hypothetical protein SAMN05443144_13718 [Fodinibius roseus]|uniref:Right handed beta helix region n=1 Tax=Fodinibius roseus TaxID=1194090 RepID=A0A1M5L4U2_9BACT|nr:hypothetical protein [Fodinibius roseus]SHG59789.1 hypothetical protein SAMN05443144_13718 [Fodinibius roseus]